MSSLFVTVFDFCSDGLGVYSDVHHNRPSRSVGTLPEPSWHIWGLKTRAKALGFELRGTQEYL